MQDASKRAFSAADLSHEIINMFTHELQKAGFKVASQVPLPLIYEAVKLDIGYRLDLVVEDLVIVEIKAIEKIVPVHKAQLLSYLRMSKMTLGLVINFNVGHLKEGIHRVVNGDDWRKPS